MARKRQTIGDNPLDALVPSAVAATKTNQEGRQPDVEPERPEQEVKEDLLGSETPVAATLLETEDGEQEATSASTIRMLKRENKELFVRIKELELERVAGTEAEGEGMVEGYGEVSEESSGIISIMRDLEGELDAAFALREALEADLDAAQKKLSEESAVRAELEARVESLRAQAALVDQFREDIAFVEQERAVATARITETAAQLERITEDRDSLAEQLGIAEKRIEDLREKLNASNIDLTDMRTRLEEQKTKNDDLVEANKGFEREIRTLTSKYESAEKEIEAAKKALRDIRTVAAETTGRARQRYYRPTGKD